MDDLHSDLLKLVVPHLPLPDRARIARTCKRWRGLINLYLPDVLRSPFSPLEQTDIALPVVSRATKSKDPSKEEEEEEEGATRSGPVVGDTTLILENDRLVVLPAPGAPDEFLVLDPISLQAQSRRIICPRHRDSGRRFLISTPHCSPWLVISCKQADHYGFSFVDPSCSCLINLSDGSTYQLPERVFGSWTNDGDISHILSAGLPSVLTGSGRLLHVATATETRLPSPGGRSFAGNYSIAWERRPGPRGQPITPGCTVHLFNILTDERVASFDTPASADHFTLVGNVLFMLAGGSPLMVRLDSPRPLVTQIPIVGRLLRYQVDRFELANRGSVSKHFQVHGDFLYVALRVAATDTHPASLQLQIIHLPTQRTARLLPLPECRAAWVPSSQDRVILHTTEGTLAALLPKKP